ncbi:MAG: hypothetical protein ACTH0H_12765 [Brachybacterium sp.]
MPVSSRSVSRELADTLADGFFVLHSVTDGSPLMTTSQSAPVTASLARFSAPGALIGSVKG